MTLNVDTTRSGNRYIRLHNPWIKLEDVHRSICLVCLLLHVENRRAKCLIHPGDISFCYRIRRILSRRKIFSHSSSTNWNSVDTLVTPTNTTGNLDRNRTIEYREIACHPCMHIAAKHLTFRSPHFRRIVSADSFSFFLLVRLNPTEFPLEQISYDLKSFHSQA